MIYNNSIHAVLFDLDGTLLDTAPDLGFAMNQTLQQFSRESLPIDEWRHHIHAGSQSMVCHGFQITADHPNFLEYKQIFLNYYYKHLADNTEFYPGISDVLQYLDDQQIPWGIVTNKPGWLTKPLLEQFQLTTRSQCIISGDSLPKRKPDPLPLQHACQLMKIIPTNTVYIGDTEVDIQAAIAANMKSIAVTYGYHPRHHSPQQWHWSAEAIIDSAYELLPELLPDLLEGIPHDKTN